MFEDLYEPDPRGRDRYYIAQSILQLYLHSSCSMSARTKVGPGSSVSIFVVGFALFPDGFSLDVARF